jgi:hypothetical protein
VRPGKDPQWYALQGKLFFLFSKKKLQNHIYNNARLTRVCRTGLIEKQMPVTKK